MVAKNEHSQTSCCPIAHALDVFGDHWSLLIVRDMLILGRHEYKELLQAEEGISSNILSDRLDKLQQRDLVASIPHPDSKKRKLYYLTPAGKDLVHVLLPMGRWALKHPANANISARTAQPAFLSQPPQQQAKFILKQLSDWEKRYHISPT